MSIPQIRMEQTFARIDFSVTKPVQKIEQLPAEIDLHQIPTRMSINRTSPTVMIDQTDCFAEVGIKSAFRANAENAQLGHQAALEGIARIAQEGIQLRSIEYGQSGAQLKQIDRQKMMKPMLPSQLTFIPSYGSLKIQGIPGQMQIEWRQGGVEINPVTHQTAIHNYIPGKVEAYLAQRNSLRIWVEPNVNTRL